MYFVENKRVAVKPFPLEMTTVRTKTTEVDPGRVSVGFIENKSNIIFLEVVFQSLLGPNVLYPGFKVAIKSNSYNNAWAKEKFEVDGKEFIFVPESEVLMVEKSGY